VGGRKILVLNHENKFYAVDNTCPHLKLPLKSGKIEDGAIVCSFHRSAFDLTTGAVKTWCPWPPGVGKLLSLVSAEKTLPAALPPPSSASRPDDCFRRRPPKF
jgi:nitrite reductase/ring-hydroxylating ferredoxin subunit